MRPIIKKVLKITAIILLVLVLLISGVIFWILHSLKAELGDHWKDYANAFTMQTVASPSEVKSKHNGLLRQSHIDHPCDI